MNTEDIIKQAEKVRAAAFTGSDETAHYEQDELYRKALRLILTSPPEMAKEITAIALSTEDEIFSHWYA